MRATAFFCYRAEGRQSTGAIEMLSAQNPEPWMIQKFLPIAKLGDKRIVILDGEPVGVFVRYPAKG